MKEYKLTVDEEYSGERVDRYVCEVLADFSRSYIQKLIKDNNLTINDKVCKASARVLIGDNVLLITPDSVIPDTLPENIPLDILYEDDSVLVVNKPKDMVVHPAPGHYEHTLVNAILYHCKDNLSGINGVLRPGIVHRIDKDTSGSVIICKNNFAHEIIAEQLKNHSLTRKYLAVVEGNIDEDGTVDKPIGRNPNDRKKMCVNVFNSKNAVTHYRVLKRFNGYTYVECVLETGRTHQIRVHMASIGHPVVGDEVYGNKKPPIKTNGQALHAYILGFKHPLTGEYIETTAPVPEYFSHLVSFLETQKSL